MKRVLPPWCKEAKKALVDRDMNVSELSEEIGLSRVYVSGVVNGRVYAPEIAARIGKALELNVEYTQNIV